MLDHLTSDFHLQQFSIRQHSAAMKVGTDAIALGAWIATLPLDEPRTMLDIGTGTGILLLMLAQRYSSAIGVGLDIDTSALIDAEHNVASSPYTSRLSLYKQDFSHHIRPENGYDLIISNPPYYEASGIASPTHSRHLARQESSDGLTLPILLGHTRKLLATQGTLAIVIPADRLDEVRLWATQSRLWISHLCAVYSTPQTLKRYLIAMHPLIVSEPYQHCQHTRLLLRNSDGSPSDEYRHLTKDYLRN